MTFTNSDLVVLDRRVRAEIDPEDHGPPTEFPGRECSPEDEDDQEEMAEDAG